MSQASGFKKRRPRGATGDEGVWTSADGADSSWRTPHIAVPNERKQKRGAALWAGAKVNSALWLGVV